jgi:hypothetical protein
MKTTPLSEVATTDCGLVIGQTKGQVEAVWDQRKGEGQFGPWTSQDVTLKDGNVKVKCSFWDKPDMRPYMGKVIYLMSTPDKKGAIKGLEMKQNNYTKKDGTPVSEKKLNVGKSVKIGTTEEVEDDIPMGGATEDDGGFDAAAPTPPPATPAPAPKPHAPVYGATVGMAINNACEILSSIGTDPFSPEFYKQLHQVASDIARVAQMIEAGNLAPTAKQRAGGAS